jgi:hypothetical protein
VLPDPRARTLRQRVADLRLPTGRTMAGLLILALAGSAFAVDASLDGRSAPARRAGSRAREAGAAGVAAAYSYPLRCLSISIAVHDPRFARADFDRRVPCGRYAGYPTAVFHRLDGAWVPVLDAVSYSCPVRSIPTAVQADLGICLIASPPSRSSGRAAAAFVRPGFARSRTSRYLCPRDRFCRPAVPCRAIALATEQANSTCFWRLQGSAAPRAETRVRARAVSPLLRHAFSGMRPPGRGETALTRIGA